MALIDDLNQVLQGFSVGDISRRDTEAWLNAHAQLVADESAPDIDRLYGRVSSLLAELSNGSVTEPDGRKEIADFLSQVRLDVHTSVAPAQETSVTSASTVTVRQGRREYRILPRFTVAPSGGSAVTA